MLSPKSLSVGHFFDRSDPEKQYILKYIENLPDAKEVMKNYQNGLELINSDKHYYDYLHSGFFVVNREDTTLDTREEVLNKLARHFGFIKD